MISIDTQHDDMILDYYGKRLATCSSDRTIKVYEIADEQHVHSATITGHDGPVWQVSWAHPKFGVLLASCSYDGRIIIHREGPTTVWTPVYTHPFRNCSVNSIAWAPYEFGLILAAGTSDGTVVILEHKDDDTWDINGFKDTSLGVNSVCWAPFDAPTSDGRPSRRLVTGSCDNAVKVWVMREEGEGPRSHWEQDISFPSDHGVDWVRDVAWAPATGIPVNTIASCSEDGKVLIWSQSGGTGAWVVTLLHQFDAPCWRVSWSLTGSVLAVSSGDQSVTLWKEGVDKRWSQISSVTEAGPGAAILQ